MDLDVTVVILTVFAVTAIYLWFRRHDHRLPPCPITTLPIVGHLLSIDRNPRPQFKRWRKECGDIYSLYMGPKLVVVLNGFKVVKEALVKNGDRCSDRPFVFYDVATGYPHQGITFSSGHVWAEQREVSVHILRALGMGKNVIAERIMEILEIYIEELTNLKGKPTDIDILTSVSVANVICSIVIGHSFKHEDQTFRKVLTQMREIVKETQGTSLLNFFQWLRYLPGDLFSINSIRKRAHYVMDVFVEGYIRKKGQDEFDENNPDNFIAAYIGERNKRLKAELPTTMDDINLKRVVYDLFAAGLETSAVTLAWCTLYLLHFPEWQEKIYSQIVKEVGTQRFPNLHEKQKLTFLNAFILEIQRLASIVPQSILHKSSDQVTICGYTIPKGTVLLVDLDSVLWDEKAFGVDAEKFRPERFIDDDGKIKVWEEFIPFSVGKRVCPGEALAKMELYLFLAAMVQRFVFLPTDPSALPPMKEIFGLTAMPHAFEIRLIDRRITTAA